MPARVVRVVRVWGSSTVQATGVWTGCYASRRRAGWKEEYGLAATQAGELAGVAVRCKRLVSGGGSTVLRQGQDLGSTALPSRDRAVAA